MNAILGNESSILLIDDSTLDLRLLLEILDAEGLRSFVAFDGQEGYARADLILPSLILLDVTMPVMDGFATCRRLKGNPRTRDIPVIFLTSATDLDRRLEGLSAGAVDYITKPFSEAEVLARVRIHLDLARRLNRHDAAPEPELSDWEPAPLPPREATLLRMATDILRRDIAAPPSPEGLAKLLGTNEKRLNELFRLGFTLPVFAWLREERLRRARKYVLTTQTPLSDIAEHLGYSSQANFARAFNQRFGVAPSRLRSGGGDPAEGEAPLSEPAQ